MKKVAIILTLLIISLLPAVIITGINQSSYGYSTKPNKKITFTPVPLYKPQSKPKTSAPVLPQLTNNKSILTHTANDKGVLTVVLQDNKTLGVYSSFAGDKTLVTRILKRDWGTWNIEGWSLSKGNLIPAKKRSILLGGSSDWEYVFRVAKKKNAPYEFSGGSHGNEILNGISFFDLKTNLEFKPEVGSKKQMTGLKIIEETTLTLKNSPSEKYANVKRTYIILPSKIQLYTDFEFLSDVYMGTSYVCMLPSNKTYGRNVRYIDSGNIYKTPKSGSTLSTPGFENYLGKEKAMSVEIWGDHAPYKFVCGIGSEEMTDSFKNKLKVFYWDLNKESNKLYFSKYDNEDYHMVSKGTLWSNSAYWQIITK